MTDLDDALAGTVPEPVTATSTATPRRCGRHRWVLDTCSRCNVVRDPERSRRGRTSRDRGNAYEREVAKRLGVRRVGQYGGADDVRGDWIVVQCKVGGAFPERIDRWLRALPADAGQLRAVVVGDAPGPGHRRRSLIVLDLDDFSSWFGKEDAA